MHIEMLKFLQKESSQIEYNADIAFCGRCSGLNWHDNHKKEVAKEAINKDDNNKTPKQEVGQIKKKK